MEYREAGQVTTGKNKSALALVVTKLSFRFWGLITLFHCSIPVQGSRVIITPEKL
jgi:hypothetical protein